MIKEEFSNGRSAVHTLDPRIKILGASLFSLVVALSSSWVQIFMAILFCVLLLILSHLPIWTFFKRLMIVNGFILFLWFFLPFTYPGRPLFSLGALTATREGVFYTLLITLKSNAIISACICLLSTSPVFTLFHALNHLFVPKKLIHLLFFNYRYIHVLHLEYLNLMKTLKARCFIPKTNLQTYRTFGNLIAMLLIKSYDRAERVYKAMLCRGFKGRYYALDNFSLTRKDYALGALMFLFIIGMLLCPWIPCHLL